MPTAVLDAATADEDGPTVSIDLTANDTDPDVGDDLEISSIDLQKETAREFYVELPIAINASGSYHDLGAFISGLAGLPRIVTLHDFTINSSGNDANNLSMNIIAKTYRYKDGEA